MADAASNSASGAAAMSSSSSGELLASSDFETMRQQMVHEDEQREALIKKSREVLKLSKNSIYALHRNEVAKANEMVAQAKEMAKRDLLPLVANNPQLRYGALSGALEEFAEACIFAAFLGQGRIPTLAELEICTKEEYLGGVMDFTGELNRYAVLRATARDIEAVKRCRDVADALFAQLMLFDWRNGQLRRKFDAVKYTLKKLEQVIYELTLASSGAPVIPKSGDMPEPPAAPSGGSGDDSMAGGGEGGYDDGQGGGGGAGEGDGEDGGGGSRGGRGAKRGRFEGSRGR